MELPAPIISTREALQQPWPLRIWVQLIPSQFDKKASKHLAGVLKSQGNFRTFQGCQILHSFDSISCMALELLHDLISYLSCPRQKKMIFEALAAA